MRRLNRMLIWNNTPVTPKVTFWEAKVREFRGH